MGPLLPPHDHRPPRGQVPFPLSEFPSLTPTTGLEAVVFVGGVSLAEPATSIPIATIVGIICGIICGAIVYQFASRTSKCLDFLPAKPPLNHNSLQNIPHLHDQLHLTHRCWPLLQSHLGIPRKQFHQAHRRFFRRCCRNRPGVV